MILKNKKLLAITSLLTLLPIPVGLLLWNRFPETMAIHWGITGEADGYAHPSYAVFIMPLILLATHWVCIFFTGLDKGNKNRNKQLQTIVLWIIPVLSNFCMLFLYALALGWEFSPVVWMMVPMGLLFAVIGNYMPKTRMNSTIGIKVYWAYTSEENWNATHRFAGRLWFLGGIVIALCGFLPSLAATAILFVGLLVISIVPIVYSWRYYKKELALGKVEKGELPRTDQKITKASAVFLVVFILFILFVLFFGDIRYEFRDDYLFIESNMYTDYILRYENVQAVEYRESNVPGLRVGGYGSFRLLMGWFENEEFGTYIRYTYYKPEACVVLRLKNNVMVLSAETTGETQALYQNLLEQIH